MTEIFDGPFDVDYGHVHLVTGELFVDDFGGAFAGQSNGLCGAQQNGVLALITGLHTGRTPIRISLLEHAPELGDWEEIVEASLAPATPDAVLRGVTGIQECAFALPEASYRVRWSVSGMDEEQSQRDAGPATARQWLALWPAPPAADAILRQTSTTAASWHGQVSTAASPGEGALNDPEPLSAAARANLEMQARGAC
ncbi:hypothetical protein [Microbacterium terricola]|uniref:Uncharacterized protein n=1 Tax=Microbacterium terricola TaxID=344163 RepID=A0ABM8DW26_9MICO|nr:hypothetical protein [Microbacterium terricola]UYK39429.1 hypothetical protein OAU46_12065 [Microbacterium terricola]BDV29844.1 hypothetical protein Microterr_05040 [Microbacterium terricola]